MRIEPLPKRKLVALAVDAARRILALDEKGDLWMLEERSVNGVVTPAWIRADYPFVEQVPNRKPEDRG
jgi:hypothetical protein